MPTPAQEKVIEKKIREYRKKYLTKQENMELDETSTRVIVNDLLENILGYKQLEEIQNEWQNNGGFADYFIKIGKKSKIIIEVKRIGIRLNENHLRQAHGYARDNKTNWVVLTNGRIVELFYVRDTDRSRVFAADLSNLKDIRQSSKYLAYLTKKSLEKQEIEQYWKRVDALSDKNLRKALYSDEIIFGLRRILYRKSKIRLTTNEITDALDNLIDRK